LRGSHRPISTILLTAPTSYHYHKAERELDAEGEEKDALVQMGEDAWAKGL
jgi:hypothetical protein